MATKDFEYYLIGSDGIKSVPLLMPDGDQRTMFLLGDSPVTLEKPMDLCYRPPVPVKPRMVDFHSLPAPVFSKKIYDVLQPLQIDGLQLIPAKVRGKTDDYYDYWVAYIYKRIKCLDMEHSEYSISKIDGKVRNIMRFFIDIEILGKIPLEKRLIFLLSDDVSKFIFHKSIMDVVMNVKPVGVKFYPILEWYEGIQFDDEDEDW
jgi:hypothetical protein